MNQEHEIVRQVENAKTDQDAEDGLLRQYLPFIKSETAKFIHRAPQEGRDDELSIAMFAFHEAVMHYSKGKGAFLRFAAMMIKNRLIDYYRKEQRHEGVLSLDQQDSDEEGSKSLYEMLDSGKDEIEEICVSRATKEEIMEFAACLREYGLSLSDIADNCPKQERTLLACHRALASARENPELLEALEKGKKLPLAQLTEKSGVERKTLERHRKYMMAILLAYTNGYEIIRGHLCQIATGKGGDRV